MLSLSPFSHVQVGPGLVVRGIPGPLGRLPPGFTGFWAGSTARNSRTCTLSLVSMTFLRAWRSSVLALVLFLCSSQDLVDPQAAALQP